MERRLFMIGSGALALLSACGPGGPGAVTITASGAAGMNPGPDGTDRPLSLQLVQLKGTGAFAAADFFALQNPAAALGPDFLSAETISLPPGGTLSKVIPLDPAAKAIGVIAGLREPGGRVFRASAAVAPPASAAFRLTAGPAGIALQPA